MAFKVDFPKNSASKLCKYFIFPHTLATFPARYSLLLFIIARIQFDPGQPTCFFFIRHNVCDLINLGFGSCPDHTLSISAYYIIKVGVQYIDKL
jgi:hypothetical protein